MQQAQHRGGQDNYEKWNRKYDEWSGGSHDGTDSSERGGGKSRKTFKKPKEFKDDSDGCIDTCVEIMRPGTRQLE